MKLFAKGEIMKKWLVPLFTLLLGIAGGYFSGVAHATKTFVPTLDIIAHSYLPQIMETADTAYRTESPEIAIWALRQSAATLVEQLGKDYESKVYPKDHLKTYLLLTYARLAKLTETVDSFQSQNYIQKANEFCPERFKGEPLTKERLYELLGQLDAKQ